MYWNVWFLSVFVIYLNSIASIIFIKKKKLQNLFLPKNPISRYNNYTSCMEHQADSSRIRKLCVCDFCIMWRKIFRSISKVISKLVLAILVSCKRVWLRTRPFISLNVGSHSQVLQIHKTLLPSTSKLRMRNISKFKTKYIIYTINKRIFRFCLQILVYQNILIQILK